MYVFYKLREYEVAEGVDSIQNVVRLGIGIPGVTVKVTITWTGGK